MNTNRYATFATLYSEVFKFVQQLEVNDIKLDAKLKELPAINQLDSLAASTVSSLFWISVFIQPYIAILILIISAPITVPLLIIKYIKAERLKQKIKQIESTVSSLAFILENPGYFIKTDINKIGT